jgi:sugar phosphate isomerase/epimerase
MTPQITIQLYTLRDQLTADYEGTIRSVAAMGFPNVEPAGFPGTTPSAAAKLFKELGLKAPSAHCPLPIGDDKNEIIETALELGHRYLITGVPAGHKDNYTSIDKVKAMAELYCQAADNAAAHGLQVGYHNHDWDFAELQDQQSYQIFLAHTPETVIWEADIFWVARAGIDPVGFLQEIGPRGKAIHFKDGHLTNRDINPPFLPAGEGEVDLKAAASAAQYAEYAAIEIDAYEGDMLAAVQKSYTYLTQTGIATGNK